MHDEPSRGQLVPAVAPSLLREMNQRLLLDRLFVDGPATRPQLGRVAGLSQPTVIAGLEGLERAGLVRLCERAPKATGRPAAVYEANPAAGTVVGVDIGRSWLHVVVCDLGGSTLCELDARNNARSAPAMVDLVSRTVDAATERATVDQLSVTHTVIGSPGVLDAARGRVMYAANLPGWHRAGLAEALTDRLGSSLTIDNDVNLAALAEHAYGASRGTSNSVYLHIGTGVGVGLILNGRLYRGSTGAAGEVGYLPLGQQLSRPRPGHPMRGMLEESLAADAVVGYAREAGMTGRLTARTVFAAARSGDPAAVRAVAVESEQLAALVASISAFLDPELIVVGGGLGPNLDLLEPGMRKALSEMTPMQPAVTVGALGDTAVVRGAIAQGIRVAREIVFDDRANRLA